MDNRDWLILKILYEEKNITKTAVSLYISQPALTARLQQIEKEFGVKIVNRERRGVSFTPEGEYLVKCADEMLAQIEKIHEKISNINKGVSGTLKLAVSKSFTKYKLPPLLKLFKEQYPDVKFKIVTSWSRNVFNLIYNKDVHIGFVRGDYSWSDKKHLLLEENLCIVSKDKIDVTNLPNLPRIDYETDNFIKLLMNNWWSENYSKPPLISMEVDHVDTCKEMVINNLGYSIMTNMILKGVNDLHTINLIDKAGNPILRRTWMFYHNDSLEINVVRAFIDFIKSFDLENI